MGKGGEKEGIWKSDGNTVLAFHLSSVRVWILCYVNIRMKGRVSINWWSATVAPNIQSIWSVFSWNGESIKILLLLIWQIWITSYGYLFSSVFESWSIIFLSSIFSQIKSSHEKFFTMTIYTENRFLLPTSHLERRFIFLISTACLWFGENVFQILYYRSDEWNILNYLYLFPKHFLLLMWKPLNEICLWHQ